jgi:hypothetical protein
MKQIRFHVMLFGSLVLAAAVVSAQAPGGAPGQGRPGGGGPGGGRGPAAPLQNLKVLPKETTQQQIIPMMRNFEAALQVECGYCHQWEAGNQAATNFAADVKPQKDVARAMIKMVDSINAQIQTGVSDTKLRTGDAIQKVTCATCHRGKPIPQVETYNAPAPAGRGGPGGAPGGGAPGGGAPGGGRQ